jgi:hypothetical protein
MDVSLAIGLLFGAYVSTVSDGEALSSTLTSAGDLLLSPSSFDLMVAFIFHEKNSFIKNSKIHFKHFTKFQTNCKSEILTFINIFCGRLNNYLNFVIKNIGVYDFFILLNLKIMSFSKF